MPITNSNSIHEICSYSILIAAKILCKIIILSRCSYGKVYTTKSANWASRQNLYSRIPNKGRTFLKFKDLMNYIDSTWVLKCLFIFAASATAEEDH